MFGKADILRYEILYRYGGLYIDADCESLRPLDDKLRDNDLLLLYASEQYTPGRLANGVIGCIPEHPLLDELIVAIGKIPLTHLTGQPCKLTGPKLLTTLAQRYLPQATVLPSNTFLPVHYRDYPKGVEAVRTARKAYAVHHWDTTMRLRKPKKLRLGKPKKPKKQGG